MFQSLGGEEVNEETLTPYPLSHGSGRGGKVFKRVRKTKVSRELRRDGTDSENLVWGMVRDRKVLGYKFRRQHVIRGFILDFYCAELKLALEIDGKIHDGQKDQDRLRQEALERLGIEFLRIPSDEINDTAIRIQNWITLRVKN